MKPARRAAASLSPSAGADVRSAAGAPAPRTAGAGKPIAARASSTPPWAAELARRVRYLLALKTFGTTVVVALFFVGYFHLLHHPSGPPAVMPLTALDRWLPFQPWALAPYLTLWLYVGIAPGLQPSWRALWHYAGWATALCATGLGLFHLWPTTLAPMPAVDATAPGFAMLQGIDAASNACPSMHVTMAVFSGIWIERQLRDVGAPAWLRALNALWCAAIVYSTLAIKQHVLIDVLAGLALGGLFAAASLHRRPPPGAAD